MNKLLFSVVLALDLLSGCADESTNQPESYRFKFQFITENYKPLNYQEGSELKGLASDLLQEICSSLNIPFEVSVLPWEQGYQAALNTSNAVLFSTVLNEDRKNLFKWVGPYASLDWEFFTSSPSEITLSSIEDAKSVQRIGVIKDYAIEQYLVREGFTNLVYLNNNNEAFDKLLKKEIDLFAADRVTAEAALTSLGRTFWSVTSVMTILTDLVYFAFNKEIPDEVIADFQREVNRLRNNGRLHQLHQKYLLQNDPPAELQIFTEQYPPLTFRNAFGEITGFGTDIVQEIMKRNGVIYPIKLKLWSNIYTMALNNPDLCIFTMDRTLLRDTLFNWVGPLGSNITYFYTRAGSGITIGSLDEAKKLTAVGTVSSWFSDQMLREAGFTNLVSDPDPAVMVQKLFNGEVDAFVCASVTFPDILRAAGYNYNQVVESFELMSSDFYIAFSKNTSAVIVSQWQSSFNSIKQDGSYDAIYGKWFSH